MDDEPSKTDSGLDSEIWRRWRTWLIPAAIALAALLLYGLFLSFRGLGPATLEALNSGGAWGGLDRPHPLYGVVAAVADMLGTGLPVAPLRLAALVFIVGSLPAIWGIGRKLGGIGTAAAAAGIFALLPQTVGLATSVTAGSLFVFLWCWFLRLSVVDRHGWASALAIWIVGGALVLVWPIVLLWGALWLYLEVRTGETETDATRLSGEIAPSTVPLAVVLAPVAVLLAATLMHPAMWSAPIEGWRQFLEHAMRWTGPVFRFDGVAYRHTRPPLWTGLQLSWWSLPALVVAAGGIGWLQLLRTPDEGRRAKRLARQIGLWGPPFALLLPWIHRGPAFGRIEFTYVLLPIFALLTGYVLAAVCRSVRDLAAERGTDRVGRILAGGLIGVLLVSLLGLTIRIHPVEGSYYNRLAGGLGGAVERGLRVSRDGVFPLSVLRRAEMRSGWHGSLFAVSDERLTSTYEKAGLLDGVATAEDAHSADALVRRLGSFEPGRDEVRTNPAALVNIGPRTEPLLRIDGIPVFWLERQTTP